MLPQPKQSPLVACRLPHGDFAPGGRLRCRRHLFLHAPLDVFVCAYLGDNKLMVDAQKALIDACEAESVPRYVARNESLDYTKLALSELFPKNTMIQVKGIHVLVWDGTSYENAAEFTAAVCTDKYAAAAVLRLDCDRKSFKQIAEIFAKVYGIQSKVESLETLEELHHKMHDLRAQGPQEVFRYMFLLYTYY
ncbi:hypothetical protein VTI74DRAFT_1628 [Chaetomium olivicolor]